MQTGNLIGKYLQPCRVYDKDHRITPLQQSQNGNYFISPSAASRPIRIWKTYKKSV